LERLTDQISDLDAGGDIRDPLEEVSHSHSEIGVVALIDLVDERIVILRLENGAVGDLFRHLLHLLSTWTFQSMNEGRLREMNKEARKKKNLVVE
jgi:hypothetical protein